VRIKSIMDSLCNPFGVGDNPHPNGIFNCVSVATLHRLEDVPGNGVFAL
jgi:hypothetical protein